MSRSSSIGDESFYDERNDELLSPATSEDSYKQFSLPTCENHDEPDAGPSDTTRQSHLNTDLSILSSLQNLNKYHVAFLRNLADGLEQCSDLVIDGRSKARKIVVCPQSTYIAKQVREAEQRTRTAATGNPTANAKTNVYTLSGIDNQTNAHMLSFLYLQDYQYDHERDFTIESHWVIFNKAEHTYKASPSCQVCEEHAVVNELEAHVRVFSAADWLGIPMLKQLAAEKFRALLPVYATRFRDWTVWWP